LSTLGQVGSKEHAKRYSRENTDEAEVQRQIILNNFNYRMNPDNHNGLFGGFYKELAEGKFGGLTAEDVVITAEEVENITITPMVHTIISDGEVHSVKVPLKDVIVNILTDTTEHD